MFDACSYVDSGVESAPFSDDDSLDDPDCIAKVNVEMIETSDVEKLIKTSDVENLIKTKILI